MSNRSEWLVEAMSALIAQHPFFAVYLIDQMNIVESDQFPTAATDGKTIYVNPSFFKSLSIPERVFVLAHEVMHGIFQHMARAKMYIDRGVGPDLKEFDRFKWNKAGDYVINPLLVDSNIGSMPVGGLYHPNFKSSDLVDEVYLKIPDDDNNGQGFDVHLDPPPGTPAPSQAEVKRALKSAANAAKAQGKLPAGIARMVEELVEPQQNWKELLRQHHDHLIHAHTFR